MKQKYCEESGAAFDEASDIAIRLRVLAGEIYSAQAELEWVKRQLFAATATGEYLEYIGAQRGIVRKPAAKATGKLVFSVNDPRDTRIVIEEGAIVATTDGNPVRICTTEEKSIPPYGTSVEVEAEAELAGFQGNIANHCEMIPVSAGLDADVITNTTAFTGGEDEESDEMLRERIRRAFISQPNGMNAAYYEQLALSLNEVKKVCVLNRARGVGSVGIYVATQSGGVSATTLETLRDLINSRGCIDLDFIVENATAATYDLNVTVSGKTGYSAAEIRAQVTGAFEEYLSHLPIGGTLYLSELGRCLLNTGCLYNYVFSNTMLDKVADASQYHSPGSVTIEVV